MKKYQTLKIHTFPCSDVRFKYYSCAFMNFHEKISNFQSLHFSKFRCEIQVLFMRFHEFSWKNIKLSKFTLFQVQMWDSTIIHALSWIFMKKYQIFKVHTFPSSDVRFKYYSCAFMNFHEKYQTLKIHTFPSSDVRFNYYSCAFMNFHEKYQTFKVHIFPISDVRFKYYSCAFMNFHEKISNLKNSHFSKLRCEIQVLFMRFYEFSWKNIKLSKFTFFQVQMWDSSIIHALSWIFIKKYQILKIHTFPSSDVRFKYYSCAFMNFHEKISHFQSSHFSKFRCEIQLLFMRFHEFSWKNIKLSKFTLFQIQMWDSTIIHALSWIFMKKYQTFKVHTFPISDVRFKYYSCAFMNFHEKISNFKNSHFSKFRSEIQVLFMRFH
jgi:uncharacterized membrane protein YccF (DUF307 family)